MECSRYQCRIIITDRCRFCLKTDRKSLHVVDRNRQGMVCLFVGLFVGLFVKFSLFFSLSLFIPFHLLMERNYTEEQNRARFRMCVRPSVCVSVCLSRDYGARASVQTTGPILLKFWLKVWTSILSPPDYSNCAAKWNFAA